MDRQQRPRPTAGTATATVSLLAEPVSNGRGLDNSGPPGGGTRRAPAVNTAPRSAEKPRSQRPPPETFHFNGAGGAFGSGFGQGYSSQQLVRIPRPRAAAGW